MTPVEVDIWSTVPCTTSFIQMSHAVRALPAPDNLHLIAPNAAQLNLQGAANKSLLAKVATITVFAANLAIPVGASAGLIGTISERAGLIVADASAGVAQELPAISAVFQKQAPNPAITLQSVFAPTTSVPFPTVTVMPGAGVTTYEYTDRQPRPGSRAAKKAAKLRMLLPAKPIAINTLQLTSSIPIPDTPGIRYFLPHARTEKS
jgi:hypothetical protein